MVNASIIVVRFRQISLKSGSRRCHAMHTLIYFAPLCWAKKANSGLVRRKVPSYVMILL
jgi:hypothetical protein